MPEPRLAARIVVQAMIRAAERAGGHGTVIASGDPIAGTILVLCAERGEARAALERAPTLDGTPVWARFWDQVLESEENLAERIAKRRRGDPDLWLIELDVAHAERLVAELGL